LSLRKAAIKGGISTRSFYDWIEKDVELQQQYARATISRADSIFEEILDIADDSSGDKKITENGEVMDSEYVQRSRLRVDARKWAVSKMNPKKYGEKQVTENINKNFDLSNLSDEEFQEQLDKANKVLNG
jgi:hypothetical protein